MIDNPKLLIVDDEPSICRACRRVFSRQGYEVEHSSDPVYGLSLAENGGFDAILLDVKMPEMDGFQFLQKLRETNRSVPVVVMTGYPQLPSADSVVQLGVSRFVMKPFTPEEIFEAVQTARTAAQAAVYNDASPDGSWFAPAEGAVEAPVDLWRSAEEARFLRESWSRLGENGLVRMGVLLTRAKQIGLRAIRLPKLGQKVIQGEPIATLEVGPGRPPIVVAAAVSGEITAVNASLMEDLSPLIHEPCCGGWIVESRPVRYADESKQLITRRLFLLNSDAKSSREQIEKLRNLGCEAEAFAAWSDLAPRLPQLGYDALMVHAPAFGEEGPSLVGRANEAAPDAKVIVNAAPGTGLEAAYRAWKIFYFAVEPFADNEIVDILDAVFVRKRH